MTNLTPSLNQLAFAVLNTVRGRSVITDVISLEQIKYHIKNTRAQLIKQESNKGYTADNYIIQNLGCVSLVLADKSECCEVSTGCTILRTELAIPSVIELHHTQLFTRIGAVDITLPPFDFVSYERIPYEKYGRFNNTIKAFMMNNKGYMYFLVPNNKLNLMKYANIQGVFEDPEDVSRFNNCDGTTCYNDDTAFPVKAWMANSIEKIVIDMFIDKESKAPMDLTNNSKMDVTSQTEGN
jgi:hypothetical protein